MSKNHPYPISTTAMSFARQLWVYNFSIQDCCLANQGYIIPVQWSPAWTHWSGIQTLNKVNFTGNRNSDLICNRPPTWRKSTYLQKAKHTTQSFQTMSERRQQKKRSCTCLCRVKARQPSSWNKPANTHSWSSVITDKTLYQDYQARCFTI